MQPVSTGQNVRLIGYISYQGTEKMIGDLKESASVKQSGLSERLTEIRNSAAEFFTAVKGKINNVFESLGIRINKITIREEKTQSDANQNARLVLDIAQKNVPIYLDKINTFMGENKPLTATSLNIFSTYTLRPLVTFMSGVNKVKGIDKAAELFIDGLINRVNRVLSGAVGFGLKPDEKVDQLGSICDDGKAAAYLATENFEQNFNARVMELVKDIQELIMADLMDIRPEEVIAREKPQTENNAWRRLPDN